MTPDAIIRLAVEMRRLDEEFHTTDEITEKLMNEYFAAKRAFDGAASEYLAQIEREK